MLAPRPVDELDLHERSIGQPFGDDLPLAQHTARGGCGRARPVRPGQRGPVVDRLPGDRMERRDIGQEGPQELDRSTVIPLADRGQRQARAQCLLQEWQCLLKVCPGRLGRALVVDDGLGNTVREQDASMLLRLHDAGMSVQSTGQDDDWGEALVVSPCNKLCGNRLVGAEDEMRTRRGRRSVGVEIRRDPCGILPDACPA